MRCDTLTEKRASMRGRRTMIAAALLQCAFLLHGSDGVAAQNQSCVSSPEVECFVPTENLASGPVGVEVRAGQSLHVSLEHFSEYPVCHWMRGDDHVQTANGSLSMVLSQLSQADSGEYTLSCETVNQTRTSLTVSVCVRTERPSKPRLLLDRVNIPRSSPYFKCISEDCSKHTTLKWSGNDPGKGSGKTIELSSTLHLPSETLCCAVNGEKQECSQLYDYDIDTHIMKNGEFSNVTASPGESLLLRCRSEQRTTPKWEIGDKIMDVSCSPSLQEEICVKEDKHAGNRMAYLFIRSVSVNHTGTYKCKVPGKTVKSVYIDVQDEGSLSVHMDENKIIAAQNRSSPQSCLQASLSYHPVLQRCSWEAPDKSMSECLRDTWVTKHRTVKLCDLLQTGDYKLHLEAGGQNETKVISVCVVDEPKFIFRADDNENTVTIETETLVPANYSWMTCPLFNDSCDTPSSWTKILDVSQTDSEVVCKKPIRSSLSRDLAAGHRLKFCLTNSVDSWCHIDIHYSSFTQASTGRPRDDDSSLMLMKVGSILLLVALAVLTVLLLYFVKKKKPKYQPQLQMIQMVGPNDNDYIYINFNDFEYDQKWEFPRENLELGKELGSGAFGMVLQATAYGINKPGVSQQVAVKMLKDKHEAVEKEALMSELKMLIHIGHHSNIVNLLGACTESGPTYLIFQYCCYGDLLNYLKKNRERYHKSVTDAFTKDRFSSIYHNLHPRKSSSELTSTTDNYVFMHSSTSRGQEDIALLTLNSGDMDGFDDPEIHENTHDDTEDLQTLTFDDLLSFAFQVAKGMEFLSSKNCIHRDLAARNVLVTKGRLVKIGDFGLARDIDNDSNYVVRGNVRLPVKWMAPESTFQGIYTMKSDVWAYGILLWEIFSLGVTPYPGMKVDHTFYSMIERGFKMECPYYANDSVYEIMCKCWALQPCDRPSFSKLVSFMCDELTDREEKLYHNMLDQTCSIYQNAPAVLEFPALTDQTANEMQSAGDDCRTHATEEGEAETCDPDAITEGEEKPLRSSDTECP